MASKGAQHTSNVNVKQFVSELEKKYRRKVDETDSEGKSQTSS
jgi:hypothetical protein